MVANEDKECDSFMLSLSIHHKQNILLSLYSNHECNCFYSGRNFRTVVRTEPCFSVFFTGFYLFFLVFFIFLLFRFFELFCFIYSLTSLSFLFLVCDSAKKNQPFISVPWQRVTTCHILNLSSRDGLGTA